MNNHGHPILQLRQKLMNTKFSRYPSVRSRYSSIMTKTKYATTYYCSAYKKWCELILEISSMIKIHKTQAKINIIILMRRSVAIGDREQI